jgi:hypothetical protein
VCFTNRSRPGRPGSPVVQGFLNVCSTPGAQAGSAAGHVGTDRQGRREGWTTVWHYHARCVVTALRRALPVLVVCSGLVLAGMPAVAMAAPGTGPSGCPAAAPGQGTCVAVAPGRTATPASAVSASTPPPGYGPLALRYAYGLEYSSITGGVGQTVAVVTAYDDSTAVSDVGTYRSEFGLPACTAASGCFSKVDADGGTNYPASGPAGWTLTDAEELDMVSAVCPNCHLLLVEADLPQMPTTTTGGTTYTGIGQAVNEAVALGAKFVVTTFAGPEVSGETGWDTSYFDHPEVVIAAPDGSSGYGTSYPAASPDVIAVGGTTLTQDTGIARGWTETAWSDTGSGCSPYEAKPSWQTDTGCTSRMLNDVSAVASPNTPVAVYDTNSGDWVADASTGTAAAIVAAAAALAGTPASGVYPAQYLYANATGLNDITSGSNGTCSITYFCTAGPGYDGPTGLGTPASAAAFGAHAPDKSMPGGPVVFDPASGNLEVYATGTGATLEQDAWTPGPGWNGWTGLGGSITGTPSAVYDPASGNLEVYATGTGKTLEQDTWTPGTGWDGWTSLGGSITGSPSAVYDPASGNLEVYATGTGATLEQDAWTPGTGWHGWTSLGGSITGSPSAVYDPASGNLEVYATGTGATLEQDTWTPGTGWHGWTDLGGSVTGTPAAVYDPLDGAFEVYAAGTGGALEEKYFNPSSGWSAWTDLGGSITGSPSAVYDPASGNLEVYATGSGKTLEQDAWTPATGWHGWTGLGGSITGSPSAVYDPASGNLEVYATGTGATLEQDAWTLGTGWHGWTNLGGALGDL